MPTAIPLTGRRGAGLVALVDDDDAPRVLAYARSYHVDPQGYPRATVRVPAPSLPGREGGRTVPRPIPLHAVVLPVPPGATVDHANGVKTDCRKANLRLVVHGLNVQNAPGRGRCPYRGVQPAASGRFTAAIGCGPTRRHLGTFDTAEQAARAYDRAALALYGAGARRNLPDGEGA